MPERIYINLKVFDNIIRILRKLHTVFPNAKNVKTEIDELKRMQQPGKQVKLILFF